MYGMMIIILISGMLITILHETGHYLVSRHLGLHPDLFKIGVGPVIFKKGILNITALPFSGRVNHPDAEWVVLPKCQQDMIAVAGPMVNLVIGALTIWWLPIFGLLNFVAGFGNMIPMRTSRGMSDGGYVLGDLSSLIKVPISLTLILVTSISFFKVALLIFGQG